MPDIPAKVTNVPEETKLPDVSDKVTSDPEETKLFKTGDVDEDENINASDAIAVLKYAAKMSKSGGFNNQAANVNHDGNIDAADALQILQMAAKLINSFE